MITDPMDQMLREIHDFEEDGERVRLNYWATTQEELTKVEGKRARRIRDKLRMKARARWVARVIWSYRPQEMHKAHKYADNLKPCSCWMCGNQRRHHGPRPQEFRALAAAQQDLGEEFSKVLNDNLWDLYVQD